MQKGNYWIFLRGLIRGQGHWGDFIELFKKENSDAQIELLDLPGNGERYKESSPWKINSYVESIRSQSKWIHEKKNINLVGHSLGGMIAIHWAKKYPQEITQLFVINTSLKGSQPVLKRFQPQNLIFAAQAFKAKSFLEREKFILNIIANNQERAEELLPRLAHYSETHPIQRKNFLRQILAASQASFPKSLQVPVKVIASEGDRLCAYQNSQSMAKKWNCQLSLHPWAGHDIGIDDPEWLLKNLKLS